MWYRDLYEFMGDRIMVNKSSCEKIRVVTAERSAIEFSLLGT